MSTAQDHIRIAAELTDVFGPGAGSSGYNFNSGVATFSSTGAAGPQGSGGSQGSAGNILGGVNAIAQPAMGMAIQKSIKDMAHTVANAETLEEFDSAIKSAERVSNAAATAKKVSNAASVSQGLTALGDVTSGQVPPIERIATDVVKGMTPLGPISAVTGAFLKEYDPIAPIVQAAEKGMRYVPGVGWVNDKLSKVGQKIKEVVPSEVSAALTNTGNFANEILDIGGKTYRSFRDADEIEASDRDKALTQLFTQEGSDGRLYISPPTSNEEVVGVDLPGNVNSVGVGSYSGRYNFPADEGKTRQQLFEEFQNSETYKGLVGEKRGLQSLATQAEGDALADQRRKVAISELADPVQNIVPISTYVEDQRGTHYSDEYGAYDAQTGEKLDVPGVYDPAPGFPITEPIPFEAPAAPAIEYYGPKAPKPAEIAPMSQSDGSSSLDGGLTWSEGQNPMKRVRPEDFIGPIRPQRETASGGLTREERDLYFSHEARRERDLARHEMAVEKESARKAKLLEGGGYFTSRLPTGYSKAQAAAPLRMASQYMDLGTRTKPKHNLRELPTGLNASSYRG